MMTTHRLRSAGRRAARPVATRLFRLARRPSAGLALRPMIRLARRRPRRIRRGPAAGLRIRLLDSNIGFVLGTSEYRVQQAISERLTRGSVFYDVGAYVGFYSLLASRCVGPSGHVVAFEPFPQARETLLSNLAENGVTNVEV